VSLKEVGFGSVIIDLSHLLNFRLKLGRFDSLTLQDFETEAEIHLISNLFLHLLQSNSLCLGSIGV